MLSVTRVSVCEGGCGRPLAGSRALGVVSGGRALQLALAGDTGQTFWRLRWERRHTPVEGGPTPRTGFAAAIAGVR